MLRERCGASVGSGFIGAVIFGFGRLFVALPQRCSGRIFDRVRDRLFHAQLFAEEKTREHQSRHQEHRSGADSDILPSVIGSQIGERKHIASAVKIREVTVRVIGIVVIVHSRT